MTTKTPSVSHQSTKTSYPNLDSDVNLFPIPTFDITAAGAQVIQCIEKKKTQKNKEDASKNQLPATNFNIDDEEWEEIDAKGIPATGGQDEEPDWETVEVGTENAGCELPGEDGYSLDTFRSSKRK